MTETLFGGLNMIFAGDFAQLKPVFGSPLYSNTVGTSVDASMSVRSQQSAIGKAAHIVKYCFVLSKTDMDFIL